MKHFYTTKEVQQMLSLGTERTALNRIQSMNAVLHAKGLLSRAGGRFWYHFFMRNTPKSSKEI